MGNRGALVWASQPTGQITIQKLIVGASVTTLKGFKACEPATISFKTGFCGGQSGGSVTATGCVVSSYVVTAETDGMTVMENITIDFVSLS